MPEPPIQLKPVIINSLTRGGAGIAAVRLHNGLRQTGLDCKLATKHESNVEQRIFASQVGYRGLIDRAQSMLSHWMGFRFPRSFGGSPDIKPTANCELFSDCRAKRGNLSAHLNDRNVLNLHWVAGLVDLPRFFRTYGGKVPIVWTLHDMFPFTGGCHYDDGCGRYTSQCRNCPQLDRPGPRDWSQRFFAEKKGAFSHLLEKDLHIVALSNWIKDCVAQSELLSRFDCTIIPNGIDVEEFQPIPKRIARQALNLPLDKKYVLFIAENISNRRKGFDLLSAAMPKITSRCSDVLLLSAGEMPSKSNESDRHLAFGSIRHSYLLRLVYSAADLFIIPSRQDNLPNTVLEAMACGTVPIGFNVGGMQDMIRKGCGWLVESIDSGALANCVLDALSDISRLEAWSKNCREHVEEKFSVALQAARYRDLFAKLLDRF